MTLQTNPKHSRPRRMACEPQPTPSNALVPSSRPIAARPPTKAALVEDLLAQEPGASLADMCRATGWQPHTCRAFLTGLRKKGKSLERFKRADGVTGYRLTAASATA